MKVPKNNRLTRALRRTVDAAAVAAVTLLLTASGAWAEASWPSGSRQTGTMPASSFATWRGTPLGAISGWINWKDGWSGMYKYASGSGPRTLYRQSANLNLAHAMFPAGGSLTACLAGSYDDEQAEVARRLVLNGLGGIQIRLGWEANGDWFPWTAVGKSADDWKQCYTRIVLTMKAAAQAHNQDLSFCWSMGKKGRIDVRTIYPDQAPITAICLSHYDDPYDRFGHETHNGGPWGLRAWLDFAREKGVKLALGEWGVGRAGDNPQYIQDMHDFLVEAGDTIAYESYFNTGLYRLLPADVNPKASALYQQLF